MQIRRRHPNPSVSITSLRYEVKVPDAEPRHILEKIVWQKETEVDQMRATPSPDQVAATS